MVPPYSHRVSRVRRYSGYRWLFRLFVYRTLTFFGWTSHSIPLNLYNAVFCPNPESITTLGLASSAFARHYLRNLVWCLFLALLRCFSSGGSPPVPMDSVQDTRVWTLVSFLIQKSPDQRMFAPPRSLSQLTTSFIGSQCQGILLAPFVAWPLSCSRKTYLISDSPFANEILPFYCCSLLNFNNPLGEIIDFNLKSGILHS